MCHDSERPDTDSGWRPERAGDEPTPNLTDGTNTPFVETFHDVVMCGEDHVIGAFTWTRTGEPHPQWCTNPTNGQLKTVSGGEYSQPQTEGLGTPD